MDLGRYRQPISLEREKWKEDGQENSQNILILSCGTGDGHNRAAQAIAEALEHREISYTFINPITLYDKRAGKWVDAAYNRMIQKRPGAFNLLYQAGSVYSSRGWSSPVYSSIAHCADRLSGYIEENAFSAVICTHLFAMEAMTAARKTKACRIPRFGLVTDYTCIPFTAETCMDGFFIPQSDLLEEFVREGIQREKIYPTGIPVSTTFTEHPEKAAACRALQIPEDKPFILVMGGGAGSGNMAQICRELLQYPGEWLAGVMTGRNHSLFQSLDRQFSNEKAIRLIPYTEKVSLYMAAADVILTKPGGLSSTEAAVANIPLIHLLNYRACEKRNVEFFSSRGMSVWAKNAQDAASAVWKVLWDPQIKEKMLAAQRKYMNPKAAETIVESVVRMQ